MNVSPIPGVDQSSAPKRSMRDAVYAIDNLKDLRDFITRFAVKVRRRASTITYERNAVSGYINQKAKRLTMLKVLNPTSSGPILNRPNNAVCSCFPPPYHVPCNRPSGSLYRAQSPDTRKNSPTKIHPSPSLTINRPPSLPAQQDRLFHSLLHNNPLSSHPVQTRTHHLLKATNVQSVRVPL